MNVASDITLTSACDSNYFWGVFLMVGTARQHGMTSKIHILGKDFTEEQKAMLRQFEEVAVLPLPATSKNVNASKPDALATIETEWMAWIDADCVFSGDVTQMLFPPDGECQIRVRGEAENAAVYSSKYRPGEPRTGVAKHVLERWRQDVGDLQTPRMHSTVVTNVIVFNQRFKPFVELWRRQMDKVLAQSSTGVIDRRNPDYHMTDESVLTSLLTWSSLAPRVDGKYLLDNVAGAHIGHFGGPVKPWHRWTWRALNWYETVLGFLDWCAREKLQTPPLPWSLQRKYKQGAYAIAAAEYAALSTRRRAGAIVRAAIARSGRA